MASERGAPGFLAHRESDCVAVAVRDLSPGEVEGGEPGWPGSVTAPLVPKVPPGQRGSVLTTLHPSA